MEGNLMVAKMAITLLFRLRRPIGNLVGNALSTLATEIAGLITIIFDETIVLDHETMDMPYQIDP
jgi:hypothetical protein